MRIPPSSQHGLNCEGFVNIYIIIHYSLLLTGFIYICIIRYHDIDIINTNNQEYINKKSVIIRSEVRDRARPWRPQSLIE